MLAECDGARPLAGGMSLLPAMKHRLQDPPRLVDLGQIAQLRGISLEGKLLVVGAMTTHSAVADSADVRRVIPAISVLAGGIGDVQVRHRGTIGGSIANNDPAACYPSAVLALGATVHTDRRAIPAESFFKGLFETALEPGELLTHVSFPVPDAAAYIKFQNLASRFSIVGVFVARFGRDVRVAVTGGGQGVFRAKEFEQRLAADFNPAVLEGQALSSQGLNSDLHGTAQYRAHLAGVLAQRAVAQCMELSK